MDELWARAGLQFFTFCCESKCTSEQRQWSTVDMCAFFERSRELLGICLKKIRGAALTLQSWQIVLWEKVHNTSFCTASNKFCRSWQGCQACFCNGRPCKCIQLSMSWMLDACTWATQSSWCFCPTAWKAWGSSSKASGWFGAAARNLEPGSPKFQIKVPLLKIQVP